MQAPREHADARGSGSERRRPCRSAGGKIRKIPGEKITPGPIRNAQIREFCSSIVASGGGNSERATDRRLKIIPAGTRLERKFRALAHQCERCAAVTPEIVDHRI